jgi:hypothetical protein
MFKQQGVPLPEHARVAGRSHLRTADVQGERIGAQVARWRERHHFQPSSGR